MQPAVRLCLIAFGLCLSLTSCKKEEAEQLPRRDILLSQKWQLVEWYLARDGKKGFDYMKDLPACVKDDAWIFAADGTYVRDNQLTKCDPAHPQTNPGTWELLNNEDIQVKEPHWPKAYSWHIVEMSPTEFVTEQTFTDPAVRDVRHFKAL